MSNEIEERLNSYHKVVTAIQLKQSYLAELKDRRGLKASIASEVHSTSLESIDERITNDIIDLEKEIERLEDEAVTAYENVTKLIDSIDSDLYKKILYARFINFKSWGEIAKETYYSYSHLQGRVYKQIIKEIEKHAV